MTQSRRPDGKFGSKATDISNRDVKQIIRTLDDDMNPPDAQVVLKKAPKLRVNANVDNTHRLGVPEFTLLAVITVAVAAYVAWRIV
jgi:hypothetical protein